MLQRFATRERTSIAFPIRELLDGQELNYRRCITIKHYLSFHALKPYKFEGDKEVPENIDKMLDAFGMDLPLVVTLTQAQVHRRLEGKPCNSHREILFMNGVGFFRLPKEVLKGIIVSNYEDDMILFEAYDLCKRWLKIPEPVSFDTMFMIS